MGSEKSFGTVFGLVFLAIGLWPLLGGEDIRVWSLVVATAFVVAGYLTPSLLKWPNKLWFKLGIILGAVVAPIVMALVYFLAVVPTGLLLKLFGKDILDKKIDKEATTYWRDRDAPVGSMKNQY
jgi:hypothetical protein